MVFNLTTYIERERESREGKAKFLQTCKYQLMANEDHHGVDIMLLRLCLYAQS